MNTFQGASDSYLLRKDFAPWSRLHEPDDIANVQITIFFLKTNDETLQVLVQSSSMCSYTAKFMTAQIWQFSCRSLGTSLVSKNLSSVSHTNAAPVLRYQYQHHIRTHILFFPSMPGSRY